MVEQNRASQQIAGKEEKKIMAETTWSPVSDVVTTWTIVTSPHRAAGVGGWGDAWGMFPWGQHEAYEDFTKVIPGALTEWTKLP